MRGSSWHAKGVSAYSTAPPAAWRRPFFTAALSERRDALCAAALRARARAWSCTRACTCRRSAAASRASPAPPLVGDTCDDASIGAVAAADRAVKTRAWASRGASPLRAAASAPLPVLLARGAAACRPPRARRCSARLRHLLGTASCFAVAAGLRALPACDIICSGVAAPPVIPAVLFFSFSVAAPAGLAVLFFSLAAAAAVVPAVLLFFVVAGAPPRALCGGGGHPAVQRVRVLALEARGGQRGVQAAIGRAGRRGRVCRRHDGLRARSRKHGASMPLPCPATAAPRWPARATRLAHSHQHGASMSLHAQSRSCASPGAESATQLQCGVLPYKCVVTHAGALRAATA